MLRPRRRFVLSLIYLAALATALAFADLGTATTLGLMAAGWVLLAAVEWTVWRKVAHFGAGLPPSWQAPHVTLPPPQPLEQFSQGYPDAMRDEGATWIASPGAWPITSADPEDTQPQ